MQKYLTIKQYATLSPYSGRYLRQLVQNGDIKTTTYLGQKVIDIGLFPVLTTKKPRGRKKGGQNKERLSPEQKKENARLAQKKYEEKLKIKLKK